MRRHFIQQIIDADQAAGLHEGRFTRGFHLSPTLPAHRACQGDLREFWFGFRVRGTVNLRFDDTNPVKEDTEYVDAIRRDIAWRVLNGTEASTTPVITSRAAWLRQGRGWQGLRG